MKNKIQQAIENSLSYKEYRELVADLLSKGKSTGDNQTEAYLNYSKLGNARMRRLDKTFHLSEQAKELLHNTTNKITLIVLAEGWCGDAGHALPIMNKVSEASDAIDLRVVLRDENDEFMNEFLTNGGKSIPKLVAIDTTTKEVLNTWGPRPSIATKMVNDYKEANG